MISATELRNLFWRAVRFSIVGTTAACVYFLLLFVMVEWLAIPVLVATAVAYPIVVIENYWLHHLWTFKSEEAHSLVFPRFLAQNVVGFIINWSVMYAAVHMLALNYLVGQVIALGAIVIWNFVSGSLWVFKAKREDAL